MVLNAGVAKHPDSLLEQDAISLVPEILPSSAVEVIGSVSWSLPVLLDPILLR